MGSGSTRSALLAPAEVGSTLGAATFATAATVGAVDKELSSAAAAFSGSCCIAGSGPASGSSGRGCAVRCALGLGAGCCAGEGVAAVAAGFAWASRSSVIGARLTAMPTCGGAGSVHSSAASTSAWSRQESDSARRCLRIFAKAHGGNDMAATAVMTCELPAGAAQVALQRIEDWRRRCPVGRHWPTRRGQQTMCHAVARTESVRELDISNSAGRMIPFGIRCSRSCVCWRVGKRGRAEFGIVTGERR